MRGEGIVPTVNLATGNGSNGGNGGFGFDNGAWWIIILFLFVFCGWGNGNGFGGGGNSATQGALTREQACIDNNFQNLMRETAGISDAVNLGFANLNSTICNQQYDTARMIDSLGMNVMQGFNASNIANLQSTNAIQAQIADCCCQNLRALDQVMFNDQQNTCAITNVLNNNTRDIIASQQAGTQRILDYLCNEKISALQTENAVLSGQLSQNAQTTAIISALSPKQPIPAYPVFPATSFAYPTGVSFGVSGLNGYNGYNDGCGCC